jgi:predicted transcriptional regulator
MYLFDARIILAFKYQVSSPRETRYNMSTVFEINETSVNVQPPRPQTKFKNRNRMEIVSNILDIGRNGALKTHLMYKANLSYMVVTQYLNFLMKSGLIEEIFVEDGPTRLYKTSAKGFKYLEVYQDLQTIAGLQSQKSIQPSSSVIFS